MAVTVTYALHVGAVLDTNNSQDDTQNVDVVSSGTGFVTSVDHNLVGVHSDTTIHGASGAETAGGGTSDGFTNASVAALSNGNIVTVGQDADSIVFQIRNGATGAAVGAAVDIGITDTTNADVAATSMGFVVVNQEFFGGTDYDIKLRIYNNAGTALSSGTIDSSGANDQKASVAVLDGGNIAVAWTRTVGAETEVWRAVYNSAGDVVLAATLFDTNGTINRDVSVVAMNGGGFGIVYEDNGWGTGTTDITLARMNSSGALIGITNVSNPTFVADGSNDQNASATRLSNGQLAISWDNNAFSETDTIVALVTADGATVLSSVNIDGGVGLSADVGNASMAAFGAGLIAVFHTNYTDGDVDGQIVKHARVSTGDGGNDLVASDGFADSISGNGGFDSLYGGAGDDTLDGGANEDILVGDAGDDFLYGGDGGDVLSELFDSLGSGNDYFDGGNGVDIMYSAAGNDFVYGGTDAANNYGNLGLGADEYYGSAGTDVVEAGAGADLIYGGDGDDSLYGDADNDTIYGGNGQELLSGATGNDELYGGAGPDLLVGDAGTDLLIGGAGIDVMYGGADVDTLWGGNDADTDALYGGAGFDVFRVGGIGVAGSADYIYDWAGGAGASDVMHVAVGTTFITAVATVNGFQLFFDTNGDAVVDYTVVLVGTGQSGDDLVFNAFVP